MAQIPLGNFDLPRAVPRVQPSRVDLSGSMEAGRAIERAGQTLAGVGDMLGQQATAMQQQANREAEALARAKAANALAEHRLQVSAAVADTNDQLRRGVDFTKAPELFDQAVSKIQAPTIEGLPPDVLESYQGGIEQARMAGRLQLEGMVVSARRDAGQTEFVKMLDTLGKAAGAPGADVAAVNAQARASLSLFREFGLDGSTLEKSVQEFEDRNWTNQVLQRFNGNHDDPEGLRQLLGEVTAEEGGYAGLLDPDKRNAIALRIGSRIDTLEHKAQSAADRTAAIAERTLEAMDEQLTSGIPATDEQWVSWAGVIAQAPQYRAEFKARMQDEKEIQTFLRQPVAAQQQGVADMEAALMAEGGDKRQRTKVDRIRKAVDANLKMLREDPLQYARARLGETIDPLPLEALADPSQAGAIGAALQKRADVLGGLRREFGPQVQQKLLMPAEVDALASVVGQAEPDMLLGLFGKLRQLSGRDSTYRAVMQQLAPSEPLKAYAGELAARPGGAKAAGLVLRGEALLAGKGEQKITMPPEKSFVEDFIEAAGKAYQGRPEDMQRDLMAARAVYAASAVKDGATSALAEYDENLFASSIRAAIGNFAEVGDTKVVVPWGMAADDFEDKAKDRMREALDAAGFDQRVVRSAAGAIGLMNTPMPGRYVLVQGRTPVWNPKVTRKDGRPMPVFIDLGAP